jgi:hypothetical protein
MQTHGSPWVDGLFIILPAAVTPIITWLFSLRAASRRSSELDSLVRRIEVVERVENLQRQAGSPATYRQLLDAELHDILADLAELRGPQPTASTLERGTEKLAGWRSWFLMYEQASWKGSIYKVLFYIFLLFGVFGGIGLISVASAPELSIGEKIAAPLLGAGLYMVVALAFRAGAVRDYRKRLQKASSQGAPASIAAGAGRQ